MEFDTNQRVGSKALVRVGSKRFSQVALDLENREAFESFVFQEASMHYVRIITYSRIPFDAYWDIYRNCRGAVFLGFVPFLLLALGLLRSWLVQSLVMS
jgi:hypothetical protein